MTEASIQYNPLRDIYMAMGEPILGLIKAKLMPSNGRCVSISNLAYAGVVGGFVIALGAILACLINAIVNCRDFADMSDDKLGNLAAVNTAAAIAPC